MPTRICFPCRFFLHYEGSLLVVIVMIVVNIIQRFFWLGGSGLDTQQREWYCWNLATLGNFWPLPTKHANIIIKEVLRKATHLLMAIFLLLARSKICIINFWIENDPPSPPSELFRKFIRFGTAIRPWPQPQCTVIYEWHMILTLDQRKAPYGTFRVKK